MKRVVPTSGRLSMKRVVPCGRLSMKRVVPTMVVTDDSDDSTEWEWNEQAFSRLAQLTGPLGEELCVEISLRMEPFFSWAKFCWLILIQCYSRASPLICHVRLDEKNGNESLQSTVPYVVYAKNPYSDWHKKNLQTRVRSGSIHVYQRFSLAGKTCCAFGCNT